MPSSVEKGFAVIAKSSYDCFVSLSEYDRRGWREGCEGCLLMKLKPLLSARIELYCFIGVFGRSPAVPHKLLLNSRNVYFASFCSWIDTKFCGHFAPGNLENSWLLSSGDLVKCDHFKKLLFQTDKKITWITVKFS